MIPIEFFLLLGAILFSIGAYGVVTKSNAIIVLMCIELMLNAANINFVAFGAFHPDIMGQAFVIVTITVAAAEVAVGIAILLKQVATKPVDILVFVFGFTLAACMGLNLIAASIVGGFFAVINYRIKILALQKAAPAAASAAAAEFDDDEEEI